MPALNIDGLIAALSAGCISFMLTVSVDYCFLLQHNDFVAADVSGACWVVYDGTPISLSLVHRVKTFYCGPRCSTVTGWSRLLC